MKQPALTVDAVIQYPDSSLILIRRGHEPFKGRWALPGGFVEVGETVEQAAMREANEETGLEIELIRLLGVYSDPDRDPRGHTVSVVFLARPVGGELRAATDAAEVTRVTDWRSIELAFDHARILADAFPG